MSAPSAISHVPTTLDLPAVARVVLKSGESFSGPLDLVEVAGMPFLRVGVNGAASFLAPGEVACVRPLTGGALRLSMVLNITADVFDIPVAQLRSKVRTRDITEARFAFWHIAHARALGSLGDLAKAAGKKDHETVSHGLRAARALLDTDKTFAARVREIEALAGGTAQLSTLNSQPTGNT